LPEYWNDGLNLAYIYSVECKLDKAYERMINYFKWYKSFFPLNIQPGDNCTKVLNSGFLYIFGRDHQFRPLIICQPYILQDCLDKYSSTDIMNASIFVCQYLANYMLIPGQIENWIMIVNMDGTSVLNLPDSVKKLINNMSEYFIARLYRCYILGLNAFLRIIYKIICAFVEKSTVEKVIILDNKEDPRKHNDINPENLEERFGGKAPNCIYDGENSLFPPRMPSSNYFFLENENPKDILITEEEYIDRYNAGKIPIKSVSPYIVEKIRKEKADREKEEIARKKREEAQSRMAEAKTRAQLNIFTSWISSNESFDLNKFKIKSNKFIEKVNAFKIKLFTLLGFAPRQDKCANCSKSLLEGEDDFVYYNYVDNVFLCENCKGVGDSRSVIRLTKATFNAIFYVIRSDLKKMFSFELKSYTDFELFGQVFTDTIFSGI